MKRVIAWLSVMAALVIAFSIYTAATDMDRFQETPSEEHVVRVDGNFIDLKEEGSLDRVIGDKFKNGTISKDLIIFLKENKFLGDYLWINENGRLFNTTYYRFKKGGDGYIWHVLFKVDEDERIDFIEARVEHYPRVQEWLEKPFRIRGAAGFPAVEADLLSRVGNGLSPEAVDKMMKRAGAKPTEVRGGYSNRLYCRISEVNICLEELKHSRLRQFALQYDYYYPIFSMGWFLILFSLHEPSLKFTWAFNEDVELVQLVVSGP